MKTPMKLACFNDPEFAENTLLLWRRDGGPCWIIDPGLPPSGSAVVEQVRKAGLRPDAIVLTHAHADHIAGIPEVLAAFPDLPVYIAEVEKSFLVDPTQNLSAAIGLPFSAGVTETRDLTPGETLTLDETTWKILDTSGHSPGGRSLYCEEAGVVIAGDALFAGGIGRTDFPHSDGRRLLRNIREQLYTLPEETNVLSGHGPPTTIGRERLMNPFVRGE